MTIRESLLSDMNDIKRRYEAATDAQERVLLYGVAYGINMALTTIDNTEMEAEEELWALMRLETLRKAIAKKE